MERSKVKEVEGHLYFSVGVFGDVLTTCLCRDQEAHRIAPLELQQSKKCVIDNLYDECMAELL